MRMIENKHEIACFLFYAKLPAILVVVVVVIPIQLSHLHGKLDSELSQSCQSWLRCFWLCANSKLYCPTHWTQNSDGTNAESRKSRQWSVMDFIHCTTAWTLFPFKCRNYAQYLLELRRDKTLIRHSWSPDMLIAQTNLKPSTGAFTFTSYKFMASPSPAREVFQVCWRKTQPLHGNGHCLDSAGIHCSVQSSPQ